MCSNKTTQHFGHHALDFRETLSFDVWFTFPKFCIFPIISASCCLKLLRLLYLHTYYISQLAKLVHCFQRFLIKDIYTHCRYRLNPRLQSILRVHREDTICKCKAQTYQSQLTPFRLDGLGFCTFLVVLWPFFKPTAKSYLIAMACKTSWQSLLQPSNLSKL